MNAPVTVSLTTEQAEALIEAVHETCEEGLCTYAMSEAEAALLRALGREPDEDLTRVIARGPRPSLHEVAEKMRAQKTWHQ